MNTKIHPNQDVVFEQAALATVREGTPFSFTFTIDKLLQYISGWLFERNRAIGR